MTSRPSASRTDLPLLIVFLLTVISFDRLEVARLLILGLFPLYLIHRSTLPARTIVARLTPPIFMILAIGAFNPAIERELIATPWGPIRSGWLSFASLTLKGLICVAAVIGLSDRITIIGAAAEGRRAGLPAPLVNQFVLMDRYLALLAEESVALKRAFLLRAGGRRLPTWREAGAMAGAFLARSIDRAEHVQIAMMSRGFDGRLPVTAPPTCRPRALASAAAWIVYFLSVRFISRDALG